MTYGYGGNILRIDLGRSKITKTSISEYARLFLGGRAINAKLFFDFSSPGVAAFHPDNPVIIGAGLLAGTGLVGAVRYSIISRSPEQFPEGLGKVGTSGSFGPEMKFAGYDHIVITGRAPKPTFIRIENDDVTLEDASALWGKGVFETEAILQKDIEPEVKIMSIGPAGEKLVVFATIEHESRSGTALGAVWGSKNLKAIAVRGTKGVKVYDPEKIMEINDRRVKLAKKNLEERKKQVRPKEPLDGWFVETEMGIVGYFEGFEWPELEKLRTTPWKRERLAKRAGCCPYACEDVLSVPGHGMARMRCYSPTFLCWAWKSPNLDYDYRAAQMSSDYGMDWRNVTMNLAWLMHLYDRGIITAKDTDGIAMEYGNGDAYLHGIESIALRRGFGDVLASGLNQLAEKLGPEAKKTLMATRGIVLGTDEQRSQVGTALGNAVDTRHGTENTMINLLWQRHLRESGNEKEIEEAFERAKKTWGTEKAIIPHEYEKKADIRVNEEYTFMIYDVTGICFMGDWQYGMAVEESSKIGEPLVVVYPSALTQVKAATGLDVDEKYMITVAERAVNVERAYNVREGFTKKDDTIPERFFKEPVPNGPAKGLRIDRDKFEKMKDEYYEIRGWDLETGWPTEETYSRLSLQDVAHSLKKLEKLPKRKR